MSEKEIDEILTEEAQLKEIKKNENSNETGDSDFARYKKLIRGRTGNGDALYEALGLR